ncbi:MAG: hypothetical protein R2850_10005 [Bacteroidia bacterium]
MASKILRKAGFLICVTLIYLSACKKTEPGDPKPYIEYRGFEQIKNSGGVDSAGVLHFYFLDGDGDLGLGPMDTFPPFNPGGAHYYNFIISMYEKQLGSWVKVVPQPPFPGGDTVGNSSRIPYLTPDGQIKTLEGDLFMDLFTNNPFSEWDTIKYECTIEDRALHRSNQISTPEIILQK